MNQIWDPGAKSPPIKITLSGIARALPRAIVLATVVFGGLALMLFLRLGERPFFGQRRPITPFITVAVCRVAFFVLGIKHRSIGETMQHPGALVANHVSWLDIFALNARKQIYFVSKSEVADWPGIGALARATGTMFIRRSPNEAKREIEIFEARLLAGHQLMFFPESTSTDGLRILRFKSTLFAAFFTDALRPSMYIQPVTLIYHPPVGKPAYFYGWWGDMSFFSHLLETLMAPRQGAVDVRYHPPLKVDAYIDRKALAADAENIVRAGAELG